MLNILRKYQKTVFAIVTAALMVSISFFGSYSAFLNKPTKEKDFIIGTAIDGSTINHSEIEKIGRFIVSDAHDIDAREQGRLPNIFNDGLIRKDFFESDIAIMLMQAYFDDLKKDLSERLEKQKKFRPYSHPEAAFLSAENIWAQFIPSLSQNLAKLKSDEFKVSKETVPTLVSLYLESSKFPAYHLRRFLSYQESQYQWVRKDPYLRSGDLSLFYFHSFEDWFGKNFLNLISQVVHNASIFAKNKGYMVTKEESKSDLLRNGYEALKSAKQEGEEVTAEILTKYWREQLAFLRMTESEAIEVWQKVLLSRKLLSDYGKSIFLDRLPYENFHEYASEFIKADIYTLPDELKLSDFESLMSYETYNRATRKIVKGYDFGDMFQLEKIKKTYPELVYKEYKLSVSQVSKEQVATQICIKKMLDWQTSDANWKAICIECPELNENSPKEMESRLAALDSLPVEKRDHIDAFSRKSMASSNQELIKLSLSQVDSTEKNLKVSTVEGESSLIGVNLTKDFIALLDKAAAQDQNASAKLALYSQDQETFYSIKVIGRDPELKLYSYKEALNQGIVEKLLDKKLKASLVLAKEAYPTEFLDEEGKEKDFDSVKTVIGKFVFKNLLSAIDRDYSKVYDKKKKTDQSLDFYAKHRFLSLVNSKKEDILRGNRELFGGYEMAKEHKDIYRKDSQEFVDDSSFLMNQGDVSVITSLDSGDLVFFQLTEKPSQDLSNISKSVIEGRSLIVEDAKRHLMSEFLQKLEASDSIHLGTFKAIKAKEA